MLHPAVWRATSGIAAALVLGAVGYVANSMIEHGTFPWQPTSAPVAVANSGRAAAGEPKYSQQWGLSYQDGGGDGGTGGDPSRPPIADQMAKERL